MIPVPNHWPHHYNGVVSSPCDVIDGPCCCGAWHKYNKEQWIMENLRMYGLVQIGTTKE